MRDRLSELQKIAQSLMSRSPQDRSPIAEQRAALEALQLLGTLAETTRQSFPLPEPPAATSANPLPASPQPSRKPASPPVLPTPAAAPVSTRKPAAPYGTQKQEYRPALKNEDLVGALLEYYQRARNQRGASRNLIKAGDVGQNGQFETPSIPHVDVRPKETLDPRRPPDQVTQPILTLRRDSGDER